MENDQKAEIPMGQYSRAKLSRRALLKQSAGGLIGAGLFAGGGLSWANLSLVGETPSKFQLAPFTVDITVPLGHPLCGGWIKPAEVIDDPLQGVGVILLGADKPIVLMALDWCELNNEANRLWREAVAKAVGTDTEHVAVQCVHPHNAPLADVATEKILQERFQQQQGLDLAFFDGLVEKVAATTENALKNLRPVTHVGTGKAEVKQVASNRRIIGEDGKIRMWRGSAMKDPKAQEEPEGLIDPSLRTVSFWNGDEPLAAMSYYATHPMSYYGDGRVTPDFAGLARMKRQQDLPGVHQMYFNGCGGNVAPGKYNDGSKERRALLRDRIYDAMVEAWNSTVKHPLQSISWKRRAIFLDPRREPLFLEENNRKLLKEASLKDGKLDGSVGHSAMRLAWLERSKRPIDLTCLDLGSAQILHLPGEPFVEYQLFAQEQKSEGFVCVAGYGDGGPGYIPVAKSYAEGGYEAEAVAYTGPGSEEILKQGIVELLSQ